MQTQVYRTQKIYSSKRSRKTSQRWIMSNYKVPNFQRKISLQIIGVCFVRWIILQSFIHQNKYQENQFSSHSSDLLEPGNCYLGRSYEGLWLNHFLIRTYFPTIESVCAPKMWAQILLNKLQCSFTYVDSIIFHCNNFEHIFVVTVVNCLS